MCVLILALTLIDLLVDFFFTGDQPVSMKDPQSFSLGSLLWLLLVILVVFGAGFMSFVYFIKFILNVNRNEVFTQKNISLLRKYGVCVIILSISIITGNTFADALSDGINALGEGFFALLMGEVFGIGLKLKEAHKGV